MCSHWQRTGGCNRGKARGERIVINSHDGIPWILRDSARSLLNDGWQNEKGLADWDPRNQHARTRPPPVPPQRGTRRLPYRPEGLYVLDQRSAKTDWQCRPALKEYLWRLVLVNCYHHCFIGKSLRC